MAVKILLAVLGLQALVSLVQGAVYTCDAPSREIDATVPGEIVSSGYPNPYSNNEDCTWVLKAPLGSVVRIRITKFKLALKDYLIVSDGKTAFGGNLIAKYSKCMKGTMSFFSTGDYMNIQFKSDGSGTDEGFRLEFKTVRKNKIMRDGGKVDSICSFQSSVTKNFGYIAHPGFPSGISQPQRCQWQINTPVNTKKVGLSYKMMGLYGDTSGFCETDMSRHRVPGTIEVNHCGCDDFPKNDKSGVDHMFLALIASQGSNQPGFLVYFNELDKTQCPDPTMCPALNDDRDVGFDRNGNILYEKKEVTTTVGPTTIGASTTEPPMGPFVVECYRDEMKVALNFTRYPLLIQESATLIDPNCKAYHEDATHVYVRTPLDQCGTYHNYSSDGRYVIYYNEFLLQRKGPKPGDIITRDHLASFKFECKYHRRAVMSVVHYTPARATVYTMTENFGNFTYMMRMFKTKDYKEAQENYPVQVLASKMVYLQTEVIANDTELVLFVENCKVTPSKDYNDKEYYELIEEGCARDETLVYNHKLSSVQRFNFKAFYFNKDKDASVHIHCKVRVCRKQDKNSRCVKGCPFSKRRRRALDASEDKEITGVVSLGPFDVQEDTKSGQLRGSDTPRMFVEIMIGVLGFVVIALLIAVFTVLWKRRQERNKSQLSLIVEEN